MKNKKPILIIISIALLCSTILCLLVTAYMGLYFWSFYNNSFFGNGCLYDDGSGFTEMKDGNVITFKDGNKVSCQKGKLVFD